MARGNEQYLSPYHRMELSIVLDLDDPRRSVPSYDCTGWSVLDVGCGSGQTLLAPELERARARYGIDIDATAIEAGGKAFPELRLSCARAEAIPFAEKSFDLAFSRVAIVYGNIPKALSEMYRVLKPGGRLWLAMHSWTKTREALADNLKRGNWRRAAALTFVTFNGLLFHFAGHCIPRSSFQTRRAMEKALARAGFEDIESVPKTRHYLFTARRPAEE